MRPSERQKQHLASLCPGGTTFGVPLSRLSTFRIGGPAEVLVQPANISDLSAIWKFIQNEQLSHFVLGAGSNVLFHDEGFNGIIIQTRRMNDSVIHRNGSERIRIVAEAGLRLQKLVNQSPIGGYSGLEELWGIPGSIGGSVAVNAGAGSTCLGNLLQAIVLIDEEGNDLQYESTDLVFSYRKMALPKNSIIAKAIFSLTKGDTPIISARINRAKEMRKARQPKLMASAGCVFKNPAPEKPAGIIIDQLSLKGASKGNAQISQAHANFIVNNGGATGADVRALIHEIRSIVTERTGIDLELEIQIVGVSFP